MIALLPTSLIATLLLYTRVGSMFHPDYDPSVARGAQRQQQLDALVRERRAQSRGLRQPRRVEGPPRCVETPRASAQARPHALPRAVSPVTSHRSLREPARGLGALPNRTPAAHRGLATPRPNAVPPFRSPLSSSDFINRTGSRTPAPCNDLRPQALTSRAQVHRSDFAADRMDIDNMSYEQLLELQESIGHVKVGVPKDVLSTFPVWRAKASSGIECSVCFDAADGISVFRCLPCRHRFHRHCIDEWLDGHKTCPVCKMDVTEAA